MTLEEYILLYSALPKNGTYTIAEHIQNMGQTVSGEYVKMVLGEMDEKIMIREGVDTVMIREGSDMIVLEAESDRIIVDDPNKNVEVV